MPVFKKASVTPIVRSVVSQGIEDYKPQQSKPKLENNISSSAQELVSALESEIQKIQKKIFGLQ